MNESAVWLISWFVAFATNNNDTDPQYYRVVCYSVHVLESIQKSSVETKCEAGYSVAFVSHGAQNAKKGTLVSRRWFSPSRCIYYGGYGWFRLSMTSSYCCAFAWSYLCKKYFRCESSDQLEKKEMMIRFNNHIFCYKRIEICIICIPLKMVTRSSRFYTFF